MRLFFVLWLAMISVSAQESVEFDYEVDAYYSNVSLFFDLDSDQDIFNATQMSEGDIYKRLFLNSLSPNIFLIEASIHPMVIGGLYFRQNHEAMYDRTKLEEFNWVKAITAGFEEPYALSFFIGRMMVFKREHSDYIGKNRAYTGLLVSVGDYTIKENLAHWDRWANFEIKLKGTREKDIQDLDWSFRIGSKIHENKNFVNNIYFGARRSSIDYSERILSFLYNSAFSSMIAFSADRLELTEAEVMVEKKYPLAWAKKVSFGLGVGYLYNSSAKYRGELFEEGIDNHQILIRPNFKW